MNRIVLMGRLTMTPELKEGENTKYTNFSLAVDRVGKKGSEVTTDFFNCTTFGHNAEFISAYLKKGQRILISGAVHMDSYMAKNGEKKSSIKVIVDTVEYADGKKGESERGSEELPVV